MTTPVDSCGSECVNLPALMSKLNNKQSASRKEGRDRKMDVDRTVRKL